jgi:hypothetical protein
MQSGVVAWESPAPVADWSSKTLSVVVRELDFLGSLLRALLCAGIEGFRYATRLHIAALPDTVNATQLKRILATLQQDPPGMRHTTVQAVDNMHAYVLSEIAKPELLELSHLTASRTTLIVASANERDAIGLLHDVPAAWSGFDSEALHALRARLLGACLIRVVDMETHSVLQVIGDSQLVSQVWSHVDKMGLRMILDPQEAPGAIERLI